MMSTCIYNINLQECQDQLKTWPIVQYGGSEAVSMKMLVFFFAVSSFWPSLFNCIDILHSSICIGRSL